jgi:hypothetical protein
VQPNKDGVAEFYKQFGLFNLIFVIGLFAGTLYGETFTKFRKQGLSSKTFNTVASKKKSYNFNPAEQEEEYKGYVLHNPLTLYSAPKPRRIAQREEVSMVSVGPLVYIPKPQNIDTIKINHVSSSKKNSSSFFGYQVDFAIPSQIEQIPFSPQNQKGIENYLMLMEKTDYKKLLLKIKTTAKELQLNDWGVVKLVLHVAKKINQNRNIRELFTGFVMQQLGYDVVLALASKEVFALYATKQKVFGKAYIQFQNKNYYMLTSSMPNQKMIYLSNVIGKKAKLLDLAMVQLPHFPFEKIQKTRKFSYEEKSYVISYVLNKNLIKFFATFPQTDPTVYFQTPLEPYTYATLVHSLRKAINGKKTSDALNFLLHFVQKSFQYETDIKQFHKEKMMFAEETLYYDASDSEDRAVLFSYLVKKLLKIEVFGVQYDNHMTTALYIPYDGDSIQVYNKRFVIADPTYINANIGEALPQLKREKPIRLIRMR